MTFRLRLQAFFDSIFNTLPLRKTYHLIGGGLVFILLISLKPTWFLILGAIYLVLFAWFGRRISYAMLGIWLVMLLTHSQAICLAAWLIFWVGDGLAPIIGVRYGRYQWPWHSQKTIEGSAAFCAAAYPVLLLFLISYVGSPIKETFLIALLVTLVASLVETLPTPHVYGHRPGDNLQVILITAWLLFHYAPQLGLDRVS
jgi:dolichol kinase